MHPTEPQPKVAQSKAIIWKDFSNGKMKTRKPKFREGYFVSNKMNGKEFHYRSGLEAEFYECLEAIPEVKAYDVESVSIPYLFEGQSHKYFPDITVQLNTGAIEIWEIKPASQNNLPLNQAKWRAATDFCSARGWEFVVLNEAGLARLKKRIKLQKALNE